MGAGAAFSLSFDSRFVLSRLPAAIGCGSGESDAYDLTFTGDPHVCWNNIPGPFDVPTLTAG